MECPKSAVNPVRPVAGYIGGKRNLAKRLTALIETIPHNCYAEPFVGMGGVFLRRRSRPPAEIINDWSATSRPSTACSRSTTWPSWRCCASRSPRGPSSSG
jgi:hypothetical protein